MSAGDLAVTVTPGKGLPSGPVTVPARVAVCTPWPNTAPVIRSINRGTIRNRVFISPPRLKVDVTGLRQKGCVSVTYACRRPPVILQHDSFKSIVSQKKRTLRILSRFIFSEKRIRAGESSARNKKAPAVPPGLYQLPKKKLKAESQPQPICARRQRAIGNLEGIG